ncbi:terminase small subunit [Cronobacter phage Dev-CD-23823]|uniref:Uncharacterized protein n=1 Tax=Cronobacter phage Dev-CD-23823 TaxID=1712539 RepID=A0A0K8IWM7_9CAUD|nr:terminase small subunit [Cronobacter phage Dev-CD-23823]CUH74618.1 hypothetical protein [Cronobacter phage Dev-CD-23823]
MENLTDDEKLELFKKMLAEMDNEALAKLLLNKSLQKLALLLEEDMATAADYNVIRALLKDNNIGIVPTRKNAMGALKEKLLNRSKEADQGSNIIPQDELTQVDITDFMQRH